MFVHNKFLYQTGTIVYENTQNLSSGFVIYNTPYTIETGVKFAILDQNQEVKQTDETNRFIVDELIVQFGYDQISGIQATGADIKVGRTRLQYNGNEYRATEVLNFGQPYNKNYMRIGVIQVKFEKRVPANV